MGYRGVYYFGSEGCYYEEGGEMQTHTTGKQQIAFDDMLVIQAGGQDFLSNASFAMQNEWLANQMTKHPKFLINRSGGLLEAMLANPDTWETVAVGDDLRKKYGDLGLLFDTEYKENLTWQLPTVPA